ncbi:MAG: hypothetical protein GTO23_08255 [Nitrososphaeria archaeon]|nr:hypothetical protein [Nitrososphaeria archaeon]
MDLETVELAEKIRDFRGERILLVTHRNADIDAISSIVLFKFLAENINPDLRVDIYLPGKTSRRVFPLLEFLEMEVPEIPTDFSVYDTFIFTDVGGVGVLDEARNLIDLKKEMWLIDHHIHNQDFLSLFDFVALKSTNVSSTCEIISEACDASEVALPRKFLIILLAAILAESRFLKVAKCETFGVVKRICRKGVGLEDVSFLFRGMRDISAKIAVLKALKRVEFYRCKDWVVAFSRVGAHQSDSANILSKVGVDFVAVGGDEDAGCKVSIRLSPMFLEVFNLTAGGDFVNLLTEAFKGSGGGHSMVGTVTLESDLEQVFLFLKDFLNSSFLEMIGEEPKILME